MIVRLPLFDRVCVALHLGMSAPGFLSPKSCSFAGLPEKMALVSVQVQFNPQLTTAYIPGGPAQQVFVRSFLALSSRPFVFRGIYASLSCLVARLTCWCLGTPC